MAISLLQNNYIYQQQQQQKLAQQMEKYNNSIADYNLQKVIKYYTAAINSADNANDAKYLAEALTGLLSQYGQSIDDVKGINNPLLNDPTTAVAGKKKQRGNSQDKAVIKDLSEEFGIDVKKRGTTKDWLQKAKTDENVKILDKDGKDITAEREGRIKRGDILEVNSKKHGKVQISVGGDGEINGGDDKVIMMGGKSAANGIFHGLNEINNVPKNNNEVKGNNVTANPLFNTGNATINPFNTEEQTQTQNMFTENEIKNLLAAILNNSLSSIEEKEYKKNLAA